MSSSSQGSRCCLDLMHPCEHGDGCCEYLISPATQRGRVGTPDCPFEARRNLRHLCSDGF